MAKNDVVRILLILGAIVAIIEGIMHILPPALPSTAFAIICIVLGVILLGSVGAIHTKHKISVTHWLIMIIFGVILYLLGAMYGGIIMIIAGIVALIMTL